jgi:hypothetical protein
MPRKTSAQRQHNTSTRLQTQSSTIALAEGISHQLGVTLQAFVDASIKQSIHRYILGITDPILPIPSFHRTGKSRHVANPDVYKECIARYRRSDVLTIIQGVERLEPVYPEQGKRTTFVPGDPKTYVKHHTRKKAP